MPVADSQKQRDVLDIRDFPGCHKSSFDGLVGHAAEYSRQRFLRHDPAHKRCAVVCRNQRKQFADICGKHANGQKRSGQALLNAEFHSYWTGTETYEALKVYMDMNFDGLKDSILEMMGNGRCPVIYASFT